MLRDGFSSPNSKVRIEGAAQVTEFWGDRNGDRVRIRIEDRGSGFRHQPARYNCEAWLVDENGKRKSRKVRGDGDKPEIALQVARWNDLDKPADD